MFRVAIALFFATLILAPFMPRFRADFTRPFHRTCLNIGPPRLENSDDSDRAMIRSLICGERMKLSFDDQRPWRYLGLVHLLVVSGGHLLILASVIELLGFKRYGALYWLSLISFALMNNLDPPVLRSLIGLWLTPRLRRRGWRSSETLVLTAWMCAPFLASFQELGSLLMSFSAALAIRFVNDNRAEFAHQKIWIEIATQVTIWWLMLPTLARLSIVHPIASLTNIVLAPLLGWILVPSALIAWLGSSTPLRDWILAFWSYEWRLIEWVLKILSEFLPKPFSLVAKSTARNGTHAALLFALFFSLALLCIAIVHDRQIRSRKDAQAARKSSFPVPVGALWVLLAIALAIFVSPMRS